MDLAIGMPNVVPGTTGEQLLDWARRAEHAGFSSLATVGRLEYPGFEELTVLAAAGAVTERIRLITNILIAPVRTTAELAKQAASVDQLTGGRLTLGLGIGLRKSDYELAARDFHTRGERFDQQLQDLRRAWSGNSLVEDTRPIGPPSLQPEIPLLIGGQSDAALRRAATFGIGWTAGGLPPQVVSSMARKVHSAWQQVGREDKPRIVALSYFALGETTEDARTYVNDYYGEWLDSGAAKKIADGVLTTSEKVTGAADAFAKVGVDELILVPTASDPEQVDLLAQAVL